MSTTSRQRSYTRLEAELLYVKHTDCPKAAFNEWWSYEKKDTSQRTHTVTHEQLFECLREFKPRSTVGKPVLTVGKPVPSAAPKSG